MATPIKMPQLGESVAEGTLGRWLKQPGDWVEKDEPLAEIITDKVNAELPSPVAGRVEAVLVEEGATVGVGHEIARVAEDVAAAPPSPPPSSTGVTPRDAIGTGAASGASDERRRTDDAFKCLSFAVGNNTTGSATGRGA